MQIVHSLLSGKIYENYFITSYALNPLGFSPLWFEPRSVHMWESQVLLMDGQMV